MPAECRVPRLAGGPLVRFRLIDRHTIATRPNRQKTGVDLRAGCLAAQKNASMPAIVCHDVDPVFAFFSRLDCA